MPDLEALRRKLEARIAELIAEAREIDAELRQPADPDFEERAVELQDDEVLEGLGKAAADEIAGIRAALDRIDAGTYGTCVSCGQPIGESRLDAMPTAARCIDCA